MTDRIRFHLDENVNSAIAPEEMQGRVQYL
jgi:hypothetical protein